MIATALQFFSVCTGVLLLPTYTTAGLAIIAGGLVIGHKIRSERGEDAFVALLMVVGALGALVVVGQYVSAQFS